MRAPEDGCETRPRQQFALVDGATDEDNGLRNVDDGAGTRC
jgi:hypothetical protein